MRFLSERGRLWLAACLTLAVAVVVACLAAEPRGHDAPLPPARGHASQSARIGSSDPAGSLTAGQPKGPRS